MPVAAAGVIRCNCQCLSSIQKCVGFILRSSHLRCCSKNGLFLPRDSHEWSRRHQSVTSHIHGECFLRNPWKCCTKLDQLMHHCFFCHQVAPCSCAHSPVRVICDRSGGQRLSNTKLICLTSRCLRGLLKRFPQSGADAAAAHMTCVMSQAFTALKCEIRLFYMEKSEMPNKD